MSFVQLGVWFAYCVTQHCFLLAACRLKAGMYLAELVVRTVNRLIVQGAGARRGLVAQ
jgi:hypothetical protein